MHDAEKKTLSRRGFFGTCISTVSLVTANPTILGATTDKFKPYNKVLLLRENGVAINSETLNEKEGYIFNYPYVTTPVFLINLGTPVEPVQYSYQTAGTIWPGGVGKNRSIVAFSAICAHRQNYPTRTVSFINYRPEEISYLNSNNNVVKDKQLIYCCSENSVYDPAKGGSVIGGPAPKSLTAVILEHQPETDRYFALGTLGFEQYETFFAKFDFRISLESQKDQIRELASKSTVVYPAREYSTNQVQC